MDRRPGDRRPGDRSASAAGPVVEQVDIEVRYAETDAQGVVHHSNYIVWFELARTTLCRRSGKSYAEMEELGFMLMVTGTSTRHRLSAKYGDTVTVRCRVDRFQSRGMAFAYDVLHADGRLLATGTTEHVWVAKSSGRPTRLPEDLQESFRRLAGPMGH